MGQNQSVEEPYHRRHYNVTDKKIQRQNSLSLSSPNLLGDRRGNLQRANTLHTGALVGRPSMSGPSSATFPTSPTKLILSEKDNGSNINPSESNGAGHQNSFLRLLPIETELKYFDSSDDDTDDTDSADEYGDDYEQDNVEDMHYLSGQQRMDMSRSPSLMDRALHVNSRLSRTDSYEHHPRESLDLQNAQEEEQEDLSYLSPVSGSIRALKRQSNTKKHSFEHGTIDHNHPSYFEEPMSTDMDDDRYQYSPKQRTSDNNAINSANTSPVAIKSAFLDAIREEVNEESVLKKKKKNRKSDLARASLETNRSRTGIDMIPGQQRNGLSGVSQATQPSHTATYYGLDSLASGKEESSMEESVAQLAISEPRTATQGGARQGTQPSLLSKQVGELDSRINEMEMLVTYKLVNIESKVKDLNEGQDTSRTDNASTTNSTTSEDVLSSFAEGNTPDGNPSFTLVDRTTISELRSELQTVGVRYHELNDGMLTDLMSQMRDAKRLLYQSVDSTDDQLSQRVNQIETEMHTKLLSDIESRIQERVRAMEQISSRLEKCFDTMDGRLGALETVLAGGRRPRPESMYQILQQQYLQQQLKLQQEEQEKQEKQEKQGTKAMARVNKYSATSALFAGARGDQMMEVSPSLPSSLSSSVTHGSVSSSSSSAGLPPPPMPMRIRTNIARPAAIDTIHSAGPVLHRSMGPRTVERANTYHNIHGGGVASRYGQSVPNTPTNGIMAKRSMNLGGTLKSSAPPHVISSGPKPAKKVPRPESYKELLHFWKAGGSMPNLLKGQPVATTTTATTTTTTPTASS
ncbi:hypothetical protein MVEG_04302 [Podila verticillata NRRL 6337]|nr:hypothetical protein MVEG_04302 [Podila verticillata NRRL 6337]